jgi:hypothetical protein
MQRYWTAAERDQKTAIKNELQERIRRLYAEIQLQEDREHSVIEEYSRNIVEHNEDLEFNLMVLHEFGAREEDAYSYNCSEKERAVEYERQHQNTPQSTEAGNTRIRSIERQEARDRARACHFDRVQVK